MLCPASAISPISPKNQSVNNIPNIIITCRKRISMLIVWCSLWTITQLVPKGISRSWSVPWSGKRSKENVNISTICGINVVSLCQPVPPQNKCILIGTFFWTSFGAFSRETLVWRHLFLLKTDAWRGRSTFCCSQPLLFHLCTIKNWEPSFIKILKNPFTFERCCFHVSIINQVLKFNISPPFRACEFKNRSSSQSTSRFLASRLFSRLTILSTGSAANQSAKFGFTYNPHVHNSHKFFSTSTVAPISAARRSR